MTDQVLAAFPGCSLAWSDEFDGMAGSPADPGTWQNEVGGDPALVHGTVHGPGYSGRAGVTAEHDAGSSLARDFHVYSVAWEPERIIWYLDDERYSTVTPGGSAGQPIR
jgi:beta-glucanase (GH16 family)